MLPNRGNERLLAQLLKFDRSALRALESMEATSESLKATAALLRANAEARSVPEEVDDDQSGRTE